MTIQDWGAIGEIVGGVGVIVTLIYLAAQIRQNTKYLASEYFQGLSERLESRTITAAANPQLVHVLRKWQDGEELTEEELMQTRFWMATWVSDLQDGYRQMKLGIVPELALSGRILTIAGMMQTASGKAHWEMLKKSADPMFVEWFEKESEKYNSN